MCARLSSLSFEVCIKCFGQIFYRSNHFGLFMLQQGPRSVCGIHVIVWGAVSGHVRDTLNVGVHLKDVNKLILVEIKILILSSLSLPEGAASGASLFVPLCSPVCCQASGERKLCSVVFPVRWNSPPRQQDHAGGPPLFCSQVGHYFAGCPSQKTEY